MRKSTLFFLVCLLGLSLSGICQIEAVEGVPPPPPPPPPTEEREIFKVVEQMPRFPGCDIDGDNNASSKCSKQKLLEFVYSKLVYPAEARENSVEGKVIVRWTVEADGSLTGEEVLRDLGSGCGEAALDVVRLMKEMPEKWTPGKQRGRPVAVMYNLPVLFKLEGDKAEPNSLTTLNAIVKTLEGGCKCVGSFSSLEEAEESGFISLNTKKEIIGLNFQAAGLKGEIPQEISMLKELEWINFEYNFLTGGLPNGVVQLPTLEELLVNGNHLVITEEMMEGRSQKLKLIDQNDNFPKSEIAEPKIVENNDDGIYKAVEKMPRFPGCEEIDADDKQKKRCADEKMLQFIYKTLKYPAKARANGVEGLAVIQFKVESSGIISNIKVKRDPGAGCGNAAAWVVNRMNYLDDRWTPGTQRGRTVSVLYTLPIKFKLP